jgi:hypothetical protein
MGIFHDSNATDLVLLRRKHGVRSWVVNLNPLLPLVVIFYQEERGGVEVEARWSEAQWSKNGGERSVLPFR